MHFDFAAVLVIAALVTGSIWALDRLVLAPRRTRSLHFGKSDQALSHSNPDAQLPWYVDFSRSFFPVILIVLVLRSFIVEPFRIPSSSMEPTLYPGDFILVNKFAYGVRLPVIHTKIIATGEPERGDVAVFRFPDNPSIAYIKRIVALPGDRLEYRNKQLYINGEPVKQEPLPEAEGQQFGHDLLRETLDDAVYVTKVREGRNGQRIEVVVPDNHYFAMGDNRDHSSDSRIWGFLPEANFIGQAFFIWMNLDCITFNGNCSRIGRAIK